VQQQLANLGRSLTSARRSGSSSSSSTNVQQQQVVAAVGSGTNGSSSSSSSWLSEASDSERRAQASHELRDLMIREVGEQVAEQKRQEQQAM
jgi:hypothetical protein